MLMQRERPLAPFAVLPPPAPLPSLRDALSRRAAIFGPLDLNEPPAASLGPWQALGALARLVVDALDPQPTV